MCCDKFSNIIANNFVEIKKNFKTGLKNTGYKWDEDIFMDAYIKCDSVLKDKLMDKKEALRYYWVSYINKMKNKYKSRYSVMDEIPEDYDKIDEEYNEDKDLLCEILYDSVKEKFGELVANAWVEYRGYGISADSIMIKYKFKQEFTYTLKRIKKFINEELIYNSYIQELYNNTRDQ